MIIVLGLLIIAILAIIGLVFVVREELRVQAARDAQLENPRSTEITQQHEEERVGEQALSASSSTSLPLLARSTVPVNPRGQSPSLEQWHELAAELRAVYEQVRAFEDQVAALTNRIEQLEHARITPISVPEAVTEHYALAARE